MDWPRIDYYRLKIAEVRLDTNGLMALQKGAWFNIWMQLLYVHPPGLIAPMRLELLEAWSELRPKEWEKHRLAILARFCFHPGTGSLHDVKIQQLYLESARALLRQRAGGKASADRRNKRRIGGALEESASSPYARYLPPFVEFNADTWPEILKILGEKATNRSTLEAASKHLAGSLEAACNTSSTSTTSTTCAATPAALEGGAGLRALSPPPARVQQTSDAIHAFIAGQSDIELEALQRRWELQTSQWNAMHFRGKSARREPMLASHLFLFAALTPTPQAPPAEAAGA